MQNRAKALRRAAELRERISDYLKARETIPSGRELAAEIRKRRTRILKVLGGSEADWDDWHWHMKNRITDVSVLRQIIDLSEEDARSIAEVGAKFRWSISPYYASLMDPNDRLDPVYLQSVPSSLEYDSKGDPDPMCEEETSPAPAITRRYPDRLIIKVTNQCPMYCRHCQRRRAIGEIDQHTPAEHLQEAIAYIRSNPEIRDVLITGGDALMLDDSTLDWLLTELDRISHVEIKRIGTRTLVTLPQRITDDLCRMLEKHHPLYINTQFNSPVEVTDEAAAAADRLTRAGIPLGNQAVLLKGINNNEHVMKKLNHELLKIRVRPYYIFHPKCVTGTTHFRCRVEEGLQIMENLRGYTSGLAVPTYIINAPGGLGKTPMLPEYLISWSNDSITLRTWENQVVRYPNYEGHLENEAEQEEPA
ncbi:MAG: glutamate 2,3-aminomutase [Bacillota bacterium]|jgi:lysine 2,3-aminomutase|nr:glutamate 2,3-aminomutase [Bacillota bacterium]HOB91126.1 glutamate 2,3-aminomutase [Bacillota bacterium]HPZ54252.1 glutamate 2,3-aminomutase [Bacillota bacterium]HQD18730.1 glutamate 2,3-aminomutase [Bacillota bacterium]